jgi:uncharacterized membrane protein
MGEKYSVKIPEIQKSPLEINIIYGMMSYLLMLLGLNVFVIPNIKKPLIDSLKYGFTFGIILYGVYDFTSASVLKDWDMSLGLIDILWGGVVFFLASYVGKLLESKIE